MPKGIYNPFQAPKEDFQSPIGDNPLNTEYQAEPKGDIRLDGGTFVVVLRDTTIDELPARLGNLVAAVSKDHEDALARAGIAIGGGIDNACYSACVELSNEVVELPTPQGALNICTNVLDEDEAFNRLGAALNMLPLKPLLDKLNVKIIARP